MLGERNVILGSQLHVQSGSEALRHTQSATLHNARAILRACSGSEAL
ncbi:hypothetical protein [Marinomonas alcarazii]